MRKGETIAGWGLSHVCLVAALGLVAAWISHNTWVTTSFDFRTYHQQAVAVWKGERDYSRIAGDTGPLVYPAGHILVFTLLDFIVAHPTRFVCVYTLEFIFTLLHIFTAWLASRALEDAHHDVREIRKWFVGGFVLSQRIHNTFVVGFFNDCFAVTAAFCAIALFCSRRWTLGCAVYSFAVSIKMNILLFAPGLLLLLLESQGFMGTAKCLLLCASIQVLLGWPFLRVNWWAYLSSSFDLSRAFVQHRSINFNFLPESVFSSRSFALLLLAVHLVLLGLFLWKHRRKTTWQDLHDNESRQKVLPTFFILDVLYLSNFIGVCCARSLHYQFFTWYFHTLPYLLARVPQWPLWIRVAWFLGVLLSWEKHPPNGISSAILTSLHFALLAGLWFSPSLFRQDPPSVTNSDRRR